MLLTPLLSFLSLAACSPGAVLEWTDDDGALDSGDNSGDSGDAGDGGDAGETGDAGDSGDSGGAVDTGGGGDTEDSGEPGYTEAQVDGISWEVHPEFGSLITVRWDQLAAATAYVEYSFDEGVWESSPPISAKIGAQEQILLGIPYESELSLRVVNDFGDGPLVSAEVEAATDPLPSGLPLAIVLVAEESGWDPDTRYFFMSLSEDENFSSTWWVLVLDRQGRVVWARETPRDRMSMHPRISYDGTSFLIDHNSYWTEWDNGVGSQVLRMKIDGTLLDTYDTPGLHHPFTEMEDGSLLWGYMHGGDETLERLDPTGNQESIWSCKDFLDDINQRAGYCGSNTVYWDPETDSVYFSFYSVDAIIHIDRASGETLRWFGDINESWEFDPPNSQFWWQHGVFLSGDGTLLTSTHAAEGGGGATVVREYVLDDASETLTEVWNFGLEENRVYGDQMGEAHLLPNDNILHNMGTTPRLREGTRDGAVVWDVSWGHEYERYIGRSTPLGDLYAFLP